MNKDLVIKNYHDSHWPEVHKLYKKTFGKDIDKEFFLWKNQTNPQGKSIMKVALKGEEVVGLSIIWKSFMNYKGKRILVGQSVDAMVGKESRRQGIFGEMAKNAIGDMEKEGMVLRFNFPNEAAYEASINKIKVKKICQIPQYLKAINGREALGMFTSNGFINMLGGVILDLYKKAKTWKGAKKSLYDIKEIEYFDEEFDVLWEKVKKNYPIATERCSKYLNWRYIENPQEYKIFGAYKKDILVGYIVISLESKTTKDGVVVLGHLVDFLLDESEKEAGLELILKAEDYLKAEGACAISAWMLKEWFYADILKECAYMNLRSPSILTALPIGEGINETGFVYDYKNWYITIGDSDYI